MVILEAGAHAERRLQVEANAGTPIEHVIRRSRSWHGHLAREPRTTYSAVREQLEWPARAQQKLHAKRSDAESVNTSSTCRMVRRIRHQIERDDFWSVSDCDRTSAKDRRYGMDAEQI